MHMILKISGIALLALTTSPALADDFFIPNGMDAATAAQVQRTVADHYARDDVDRISPESVTIGQGGADLVCQQGVIEQSGGGLNNDTGDIILVDPTNVCINQ